MKPLSINTEEKESKYKSKKTEVDGILFDIKKEASRYKELKLLERAGVIKDLKLQPKFLLLDTIRTEEETLRKKSYIADFMYYDCEKNKTIVEDVKGFKTADYSLKKHMFIEKYGDEYTFFENNSKKSKKKTKGKKK